MMGRQDYQEKLGIHNLDESRRENLYDNFKKVGGQVIDLPDDDQARLRKKLAQMQQSQVDAQAEQDLMSQKDNYLTDPSLADAEAIVKPQTRSKTSGVSRVELFVARWQAKWAGIFTFFGKKFARTFSRDLMEFMFERMLSVRQILVSIFHQSKELSWLIFNGLEIQKTEHYFELLFRFDSMFDEKLFRSVEASLDASNPVLLAKPQLIQVFKKLYMLKPNHQLLKKANAAILRMEATAKKMNPTIVERNIKTVNDAIDFAFARIYPKFEQLIKYYHLQDRFYGNPANFKSYLQIQPDEQPGALTKAWKDQRDQEKKQEALRKEEEAAKQPEEPSDDILQNIWNHPDLNENQRKGLEVIYQNVSFARTLSFFRESKDARSLFEINDKIFIFYTLVDFFDKEFSFLFNSNFVEYNVFLDKLGRKVDVKNTMKDIHNRFNDVYRRIKEYLQILIEIKKKHESGVKPESPEMEHMNHQRETIFKSIDFDGRKIVPELMKMFQYIIEDYQKTKKVVLNPESEIEFDPRSSKGKFCNKKKNITAFILGYQYLCALDFLMTNGDLVPHSVDIKKPVFVNIEYGSHAEKTVPAGNAASTGQTPPAPEAPPVPEPSPEPDDDIDIEDIVG